MAWNDAPPTKEELSKLKSAPSWADAPPTKEELDSLNPKVPDGDMTRSEAFAAQAPSALTLGLAPFAAGLGGGAGAAYETLKNTKGGLLDKIKAATDAGKEAFGEARGDYNKNLKAANEQYPGQGLLTDIGGTIATAPLTPIKSIGGALKVGAALGGAKALSSAETPGDIAKDIGYGSAAGLLGHGAGALIGKAAGPLTSLAEKSAVNATGATGKQASKFADNAGRELLDRGIVRFGDSQAKIAERAGSAVEQANNQIDMALSDLDKQGVTVNANNIYNAVKKRIVNLRQDEATQDVADHLEKELDNIVKASDARASLGQGGEYGTEVPISKAEITKRGFNRKAGNWADPEKGMAGKSMYQTYRSAVEDAAQNANPETAKLFEEGKKSYGLLAPIQEAAERRAATTQQHPIGGLLDMAAAAGGALHGNIPTSLASIAGRRAIAPRMGSTIAVSADQLASLLKNKSPEIRGLISRGIIREAP